MAPKINPFLLFALILLTSGCSTTYNFVPLKIQVLQPANILPPSNNKIVATFYNNYNTKNDSINSGFILDTEILFDPLNTDSAASVVYYESMLNSIRIENYFDTVIDLGKQFSVIRKDSIELFSCAEVDSLRNKYNSSIIYSLREFATNDISYTNRYYGETGLVVIIKALWEISSFDTIINRMAIYHSDTVTFSSPYYSNNVQKKIIKDRPGLIKDAASEFGAKFALFLVPHWQEVERLYYKSGNLLFKEAIKLAENNNWLKAAEIWKQLINSKNKNIAAKSMFDLAVACEIEGSYDAAIDWVIKSYYVFSDKDLTHAANCKDYLRILALRKLEVRALERQLPKPG